MHLPFDILELLAGHLCVTDLMAMRINSDLFRDINILLKNKVMRVMPQSEDLSGLFDMQTKYGIKYDIIVRDANILKSLVGLSINLLVIENIVIRHAFPIKADTVRIVDCRFEDHSMNDIINNMMCNTLHLLSYRHGTTYIGTVDEFRFSIWANGPLSNYLQHLNICGNNTLLTSISHASKLKSLTLHCDAYISVPIDKLNLKHLTYLDLDIMNYSNEQSLTDYANTNLILRNLSINKLKDISDHIPQDTPFCLRGLSLNSLCSLNGDNITNFNMFAKLNSLEVYQCDINILPQFLHHCKSLNKLICKEANEEFINSLFESTVINQLTELSFSADTVYNIPAIELPNMRVLKIGRFVRLDSIVLSVCMPNLTELYMRLNVDCTSNLFGLSKLKSFTVEGKYYNYRNKGLCCGNLETDFSFLLDMYSLKQLSLRGQITMNSTDVKYIPKDLVELTIELAYSDSLKPNAFDLSFLTGLRKLTIEYYNNNIIALPKKVEELHLIGNKFDTKLLIGLPLRVVILDIRNKLLGITDYFRELEKLGNSKLEYIVVEFKENDHELVKCAVNSSKTTLKGIQSFNRIDYFLFIKRCNRLDYMPPICLLHRYVVPSLSNFA